MEFFFGGGTKIDVSIEGVEKVETLRARIGEELGKPTRRIELLAHSGDKLLDSTCLTDLDPEMPVMVFILPPVEPGTLLFTLEGHTDQVISAVFSTDGDRVLTGSLDGTAKIWDANTGTQQVTLVHPEYAPVLSAVFSADGARVLTGSHDCTAKIWDAHSGTLQITLEGHVRLVHSAVFSADGARALTGSFDRTAKIWDANTGKLQGTLEGHEGEVTSAVFSADGARVLTGSMDCTAKIWDASTGTLQITLQGHKGPVLSAVFSADGARVLTGSVDKSAKIWDLSNDKVITFSRFLDGLNSAVFSPDGTRMLTVFAEWFDDVEDDQLWTAKIFGVSSGLLQTTLWGHQGIVRSAVFSADGAHVITGSIDRTAKIFDAWTGTQLFTFGRHDAGVFSAVFSADGYRVLTGSMDKTAKIWQGACGGKGEKGISKGKKGMRVRRVVRFDETLVREEGDIDKVGGKGKEGKEGKKGKGKEGKKDTAVLHMLMP